MPTPGELDYLIEMAMAVGLYQQPWAELAGFIQAHGLDLEAWEITAIRKIAEAYTQAVSEYQGKDVAQPYMGGRIDREAVANDVRKALRGK